MYTNVYKCTQMYANVEKCRNVHKCMLCCSILGPALWHLAFYTHCPIFYTNASCKCQISPKFCRILLQLCHSQIAVSFLSLDPGFSVRAFLQNAFHFEFEIHYSHIDLSLFLDILVILRPTG